MRRLLMLSGLAIIIIFYFVKVDINSSSINPDKRETVKRIQKTSQLIKKKAKAGELNPREVFPLMQEALGNFKAGEFVKANDLLDEVDRIISGSTEPLKTDSVPKAKTRTELKKTNNMGTESTYKKINVEKETAKMGVFDPAIEYDSDGKFGYMVYTAIEFPNMYTNLAKTEDHGKTWQFIATLNSPTSDTLRIRNKMSEGQWRNEVSTLVHDPDDPGKEWKLFSHKYFLKSPYYDYKKGKPVMYMYIAYKYANKPEELSSAKEIALFGSRFAAEKVKYNLNNLNPGIRNTGFYTEPGSLYFDGVLYLSMTATGKRKDTKIILLSSHDHGVTWKYVGTLTDYKDADNFGYHILTASSLVKKGNRTFLFTAPVTKKGAHSGTYIIEFEDISKAKLKRDADKKLRIVKFLAPSIETKNAGESDYDEHNIYGGIIMPQRDISGIKRGVDPKTVESFKIFNTKIEIED